MIASRLFCQRRIHSFVCVDTHILSLHFSSIPPSLTPRVGAVFTRYLSLRYKRMFNALSNIKVLSYGPCQFPTLGFVVERAKEIEEFVPVRARVCVGMRGA